MRLLIITQTVDKNDPVLGFFCEWLIQFAARCEEVEVICLREGEHDLPRNVHVHSLGKERGSVSPIKYAFRFWKILWQLWFSYDRVFVHMNPEYVILGGIWWRLIGTKIALWYTHKSVNFRLRLGTFIAHRVYTASRESFRLNVKKVHILGHGINTQLFEMRTPLQGVLRLITLGRISATKQIIEMLDVTDVLYKEGKNFSFSIVGGPATREDIVYKERLSEACRQRSYADRIHLLGPIPYAKVPQVLQEADVLLNFSHTGSLDKAALEALAAGVAVVTTNEGLAGGLPESLTVQNGNVEALAKMIWKAKDLSPTHLRAFVESNHSLQNLVRRIVSEE